MFPLPTSIIQPGQVAIGSTQMPGQWSDWLSSSEALPTVTQYHGNLNNWVSSTSDALLWLPFGGRVCGSLSFLQARDAAADPNGLTSTVRAWLTSVDRIDGSSLVEASALYAFDATLTAGAADVPTGSMHTHPVINGVSTPNGYGVSYTKSIAVSPDCTLSPGVRHIGQTGAVTDAWDRIVLDGGAALGLLLAVNIGDVDHVRVRWQPF